MAAVNLSRHRRNECEEINMQCFEFSLNFFSFFSFFLSIELHAMWVFVSLLVCLYCYLYIDRPQLNNFSIFLLNQYVNVGMYAAYWIYYRYSIGMYVFIVWKERESLVQPPLPHRTLVSILLKSCYFMRFDSLVFVYLVVLWLSRKKNRILRRRAGCIVRCMWIGRTWCRRWWCWIRIAWFVYRRQSWAACS